MESDSGKGHGGMGQLSGPEPDFAGLFAEPSIDRMLAPHLTPHQFEHFVKYVFEQAGYFVEDAAGQYGQGIDLRLFTGPASARTLCAAVSVKQFTPPTQVTGPQVALFQGNLGHIGNVLGYVVTTSDFNKFAKDAANQSPHVWLIDGPHLVRFINYVRGSRTVEAESTEADERLRTAAPAPITPEPLLAADDITRRPLSQTRVLALANNKGGVGKTTSALNIAFALAGGERKQQVLLVDLDPQANLTRELPPQTSNGAKHHIGDYFAGMRSLPELIRPTQFDRVWLIPSDNALALLDHGLASPETAVRFMRDLHSEDVAPPKVLETHPFDWIIIDTGPSMGLFTRAALAASHHVLMPISPGVFADLGAELLRTTIATMEALTGSSITLLGGVVTQWKNDQLHKQLLAKVRESLVVLEPEIPLDRNNIEKAHIDTYTKKKTLFDRRCEAARAYLAIVDKVAPHVVS